MLNLHVQWAAMNKKQIAWTLYLLVTGTYKYYAHSSWGHIALTEEKAYKSPLPYIHIVNLPFFSWFLTEKDNIPV